MGRTSLSNAHYLGWVSCLTLKGLSWHLNEHNGQGLHHSIIHTIHPVWCCGWVLVHSCQNISYKRIACWVSKDGQAINRRNGWGAECTFGMTTGSPLSKVRFHSLIWSYNNTTTGRWSVSGSGGGGGGGGKHHEAWLPPYHENSQVHSILPNNHSQVHNCQASVEHR
jgi:hypothetical protein